MVWRKTVWVCICGFICFCYIVQAPGKNCCSHLFDIFCVRLTGFCARFGQEFGTNFGAKVRLEKCYESPKSATVGSWAFIGVTNKGPDRHKYRQYMSYMYIHIYITLYKTLACVYITCFGIVRCLKMADLFPVSVRWIIGTLFSNEPKSKKWGLKQCDHSTMCFDVFVVFFSRIFLKATVCRNHRIAPFHPFHQHLSAPPAQWSSNSRSDWRPGPRAVARAMPNSRFFLPKEEG